MSIDVVDADPFEVCALLVGGPEGRAADAAESVDAESRVHACTLDAAGRAGIPSDHGARVSSSHRNRRREVSRLAPCQIRRP